MLEHGHNPYLVAASLAIALMSGFTGLSLTRGASGMEVARRKLVVSMSAVALGGGIWSMHFVAMLGMQLPVQFYYDALTTMVSALVAILLTGIALLFVHFGPRTPGRITLAGACVGIGIPAMHYIGMSGIRIVQPVYSQTGVGVALASSLVLGIASFWVCYGKREARNIVYGTIGFGLSVFAVHFIAMAGTHFTLVDGAEASSLRLSNEVLAFGVTLSAFAIAGAFLLMGVTFGLPFRGAAPAAPLPDVAPAPPATPPEAEPDREPETQALAAGRIPYEKEGRIYFVPEEEVAAVRAEGHYTFLYHRAGRLFCPWSISQVEERVADPHFLRCHRSYLINSRFVTGFERKKDNGVCYFDEGLPLDKAPVSRSYLKSVREKLGV
ncbi:MHYT domain-containing protein [Rhodophyticola porphyridii]|uniref:MHYT domain-containing protein n=1 Tax=Rhodophyticola porphyridii TaxID=1852017 RepID=UPI0035CED781